MSELATLLTEPLTSIGRLLKPGIILLPLEKETASCPETTGEEEVGNECNDWDVEGPLLTYIASLYDPGKYCVCCCPGY